MKGCDTINLEITSRNRELRVDAYYLRLELHDMTTASPLQPVDPATFHLSEQEKEKPWIVRKIVQSLTGRVVIAVGQTLQATGTTVVCLSPWGVLFPSSCIGSKI
jgi:hypothetical protein